MIYMRIIYSIAVNINELKMQKPTSPSQKNKKKKRGTDSAPMSHKNCRLPGGNALIVST